jgi:hypothetical protein
MQEAGSSTPLKYASLRMTEEWARGVGICGLDCQGALDSQVDFRSSWRTQSILDSPEDHGFQTQPDPAQIFGRIRRGGSYSRMYRFEAGSR